MQELLRITLRPSNTATNALYSSDVIRHLLGKGKGVVSAGMVEDEGLGGLLDVLRVRGDWVRSFVPLHSGNPSFLTVGFQFLDIHPNGSF